MRLLRLNSRGISEFRSALNASRNDPALDIPRSLLDDESLTTPVDPPIVIEPRSFATKKDAATYLSRSLSPLSDSVLVNDGGLWTWLTVFYFDQVCPKRDGRRTVRNDYHYVFEPNNVRHFYRHLLFISWRILCVAPEYNRVMLSSRISTLDKFTDQIMKRLYLTRIPCIFELIDRLYWDAELQRPRVGIVDTTRVKPGDLSHRLPIKIRQLAKTYDLHDLSAGQLRDLLGQEFAHWQSTAED